MDQMIFKRYEIKYLLNREQYARIRQGMAEQMTADEHGRSTICSLYFDTPDFRMVRRSLEHPVYKEKLRLRSYGTADEDSQVFVELKKKYDSVVYKRRVGMRFREAEEYLLQGRHSLDTQITREIDYTLKRCAGIRPAVLLSYEREAYYGRDDREFRVTFDRSILFRDHDLTLRGDIYGTPLLGEGQILMEVKTADAIPLWFVRLLTGNRLYKTSFSKYGSAYEAIFRKLQSERPEMGSSLSLAG